MSSLNAVGWALIVCSGDSIDDLFDFAAECCDLVDAEYAPGFHGLHLERSRGETRRYCFHPTGQVGIEFRGDDLLHVLREGVMWLACQVDTTIMWTRGGGRNGGA